MDFEHLFPDERQKGDTRIRQCQLVMLRMLKVLDFLCKKHQIKYFLIEGSLRGAIIYQGFLPWDDDLDLGMTRTNYEKFVQYVVPELPNDIFFQNDETDPYDQSYLPNNFFIYALNQSLKFFVKYKGNKKRASILKWISKYSPFPLVYGSSFICRRKMMKQRANYIKQKEIKNLIKAKFEDMEAYIPQGWDSYLRRQYVNYMELPPAEKQKRHHGTDIPDPFTPCNHSEILYWKSKTVR